MKIVYSISDYVASAGMERVLSNKANYLANLGFEVSIIAVNHDESVPVFFYFDPRIKFYNLGIDNKNQKRLLNRRKFNRNTKEYISKMSDLLNTIKPDIAISMFTENTSYLYKCNDGSKKILELHFSRYKRKLKLIKLQKYAFGRLLGRIYSRKQLNISKHYDKFVVLTEEDRELWGDLHNIAVIPNSLSFYPDTVSDLSAKNVVAIGRLTGLQKGFDSLINIWKIVADKYPDWTLSIYGGGRPKHKKKIEMLIAKAGLTNKIELHQTTQIEKVLLGSSILAMTSKYEGFGMVLIEAMSCGVPVIAYACKCGPRDIITEAEDGFLIELGDERSFADKLMTLIEDKEMRCEMGQAARKNVLRFSADNVMGKWLDLFSDLLEAKQ